MKIPRPVRRYLVHPIEATAALVAYWFFALLPIDLASAIGGWLGRTVGPHLPISRRAVNNLSRAFPEKTPKEIVVIVRGMWDNLARVAAEYPHMGEFRFYGDDGRVEVIGVEYVDLLRDDDKPGIFFSAHLGNWEIGSLGVTQRGMPLDRVYRAANNRMVEWLYKHGRNAIKGELIRKGPAGVRPILRTFKEGRHLAMMVDQKMNDGIPVPFFGRDAMTAPALAEFAYKFDCPVVPGYVERLKGARFRVSFFPPMDFVRTDDRHASVAANMAKVNAVIEEWVRERPEQWLWLHNRWPD